MLDAVVRLAASMAALAQPNGNGALAVAATNGTAASGVIGGSVTPDQTVIALAADDFLVQDDGDDEIVLDDESSAAVAATVQAAVGLASRVTSGVMAAPVAGSTTTAEMLPIDVPSNGSPVNGTTFSGAVVNGTVVDGVDAEAMESALDPTLDGGVGVAPESLAPHAPHGAVEVRCRFGDKWVDGFEICEIVRAGGRVRYRLRRLLDGCVLPELFNAADVRCFDAPFDGT